MIHYKEVNRDDDLYKALRYSEVLGEDLFHILQMEDKAFGDWVYCCEKRIDEEIKRRIETGISIPFKALIWTSPGKEGWDLTYETEVPF